MNYKEKFTLKILPKKRPIEKLLSAWNFCWWLSCFNQNLGLKTKLAHSTVPKQKFLYFKMDKFKNDVRIALRAPGAEKNEFLDFKPPNETIWKTPTAPCDDSHRLT